MTAQAHWTLLTDAALRESLSELHGKTTIFIVSQRASSLRHADMIIVMDDGKIVGLGEHDELLSDCLVYREIYMKVSLAPKRLKLPKSTIGLYLFFRGDN